MPGKGHGYGKGLDHYPAGEAEQPLIDYAFQYDGADDYLDLGKILNEHLAISNAKFTFNFRFKTSLAAYQGVVCKYADAAVDRQFELRIEPDGKMNFRGYAGAASVGAWITNTGGFNDDTLHVASCAVDLEKAGSAKVSWYIDKVFYANTFGGSALSVLNSGPEPLTIGVRKAGATLGIPYLGCIDELSFFNLQFTQADHDELADIITGFGDLMSHSRVANLKLAPDEEASTWDGTKHIVPDESLIHPAGNSVNMIEASRINIIDC